MDSRDFPRGRENGPRDGGPRNGGDAAADGAALRELITMIAQALVDDPESVDVQEIDENNGCLIELRVAKDDIGKVIGKDGRTAQSMRTILMAASSKLGRRAHLDILD